MVVRVNVLLSRTVIATQQHRTYAMCAETTRENQMRYVMTEIRQMALDVLLTAKGSFLLFLVQEDQRVRRIHVFLDVEIQKLSAASNVMMDLSKMQRLGMDAHLHAK